MATFITIGYGDRAGYEATSEPVRDAALMGGAGEPVQVRNHDDSGVEMTRGPYLRSELPVAGFAVIEAATLEEASAIVSRTPCAVARGVVEVWPLETSSS
jgi:hypothetical protein